MEAVEDPFAPVDERSLRSGTNLKWHRYPEEVLPAWIADMDAPLCPAVGDALTAALGRAAAAGSLGYPSDELVSSVAEEFCRRSAERHDWHPRVDGVRLVTDILGALTLVIGEVTEPGDGVILQTPVYPQFLEQVGAMGREVLHHRGDCSGGEWRWSAEQLEELIDERTRVLVLVNPHNPTGRVLRRDELAAIARLAEAHDLVVVSDEIHADLVLGDGEHIPFASLGPQAAARTVTLTSAGKAFNLAGLRCAVAHFGSERLLAATGALPHSSIGAVSTLSMEAMLGAWRDGGPWLDGVLAALTERRAAVRAFIDDHLPDVGYLEGDGTYLAWLDFTGVGLGDDPAAFFESNAYVALAPGLAYGPQGAGFARLNFATSAPLLSEILERMVTALDLRRSARH